MGIQDDGEEGITDVK